MSLKNSLRDVEDALQDALQIVKSAWESPVHELQACLNQAEMELKEAVAKIQRMIEATSETSSDIAVFLPVGSWHQVSQGYYLWLPGQNRPTVNIFGVPFNMLAIETKGGDTQTAAHPINQEELTALHKAGGTCAGYTEALVNGHPAVVFLVPFDR